MRKPTTGGAPLPRMTPIAQGAGKRAAAPAAAASVPAPVAAVRTRSNIVVENPVAAPAPASVPATTGKGKKSVAADPQANLNAFYARRMVHVEKQFNLVSSELAYTDRVSTGMLCTDLLTGGGVPHGSMVQVSGLEKGAKSTTCLTTLGCALDQKIPIIEYWDAENALDPDYTRFVIRRNLDTIFFGQDRQARLYLDAVIETFFGSTRSLLRLLPDKLYHAASGTWYFVFDPTPQGRKDMAEMGYSGYEKTLFQQTGRLWCPTDQVGMQGIVFADSWPAFNTDAQDENDDKNNQMALDAKAFSANIKRVRGILKRKAMSIFGVNQIRLRPGVMHGNPEYEPGGNALAFYSDIRLQNKPRSVPEGWSKGVTPEGKPATGFGTERSVINPAGYDHYNYIHIKNTKNKTSMPFQEAWMRTWFADHQNNPHGWDPVFDTLQYLRQTGRAQKVRGGWQFLHPEVPDRAMTWDQFKLFVLAEVYPKNRDILGLAQAKLGISKIPKVRAKCFAEIKSTPVRDLIVRQAKGNADEAALIEAA